ncbi:adenylate/guanylate cyclase domain-containing protein [Verrucomicrobiales bacterium]|nr:adenylate/guanylate cyclase domain-containing protein [Verrucomicrobiales bacterium]
MSLLFERLAAHDGRADDAILAKSLWDEFGCERTVLVLDMAGFTRTSREHGIVYYLTLIEKMRRSTAPLVVQAGGRVVKYEADNLFAVFPDPDSGMSFLASAYAVMDEANVGKDTAEQIHICAGLAHGRILLDDADFFGDAVNVASKLGEDLARRGEVLISQAVNIALSKAPYRFEEVGNHGLYGSTATVHRWVRD